MAPRTPFGRIGAQNVGPTSGGVGALDLVRWRGVVHRLAAGLDRRLELVLGALGGHVLAPALALALAAGGEEVGDLAPDHVDGRAERLVQRGRRLAGLGVDVR